MDQLLAASFAHLVQLLGGSLGAAIVALSLGARFALLPVTLRLARRAQRQQTIARALQPEIAALQKRFAKNPERLLAEIRTLHHQHGYHPFDSPILLGGLLQWPVFGLLYRTIRQAPGASGPFLWIRSLAAPDVALTGLILFLTALSAWYLPAASDQVRATALVLQVLITSFLVWKLAAGLGLYWAASNLVGLLQNAWLRLRPAPDAARA